MPKGWGTVEQRAAEAAEQQKRWAESSKPQLWISEGERAIVRFLEQGPEVNTYFVHPYRSQAGKYTTFSCLNQDDDGTRCPGCEAGMKRQLKGVFNVIQRQRPVLRMDSNGHAMKDSNQQYIVDGHQDAVVILTLPETTTNLLREKDVKYNGLMSRDVEIARTGTKFSPYNVEPADIDSGVVPMSDADQVLVANKHNLDEFMQSPTFAEAAKLAGNAQAQVAQSQGQPAQAAQAAAPPAPVTTKNPFLGATAPQSS